MVSLPLLVAGLLVAAHSFNLTAYRQKSPTQYPAGTTVAPAMSESLSVRTSDGSVWSIVPGGLMRHDAKADELDRDQYFSGKRWLPDNRITGLATDSDGGVWARTPAGVAHIEFRPMRLSEKAAQFEDRIRARHIRHGFTTSCHLTVPGDLSTCRTASDDNDGLWTAMYAAGELYRYSVTRSADALANARIAIEAILKLEQVTGRPGFPARSYIDATETQPKDGVWYPSSDGQLRWKADTSSDEIVGHMYIFGLAWDLLPGGDPLKPRVQATCRRIMDHILSNGYRLIDVTGKPTRWGHWESAYFEGQGRSDSALNAVELLSFLRSAQHVSGDPKYGVECRKAAVDLGYAAIAARYLDVREEINYSDEELAMLSFEPLLRYETDPKLRKTYLTALDQWWQNCRREHNPLWTFIYAVANPDSAVDLKGAVWTLQRFPLELIEWSVDNSLRTDLPPAATKDRFRRAETTKLIPPDERPVMKWNANPFVIKGGQAGRSEDDGAAFLLPYWFGRYSGLLSGQ